MTKINVYACYTVKIYKNKPVIFFSKGGGGARARRAGPGSAFGDLVLKSAYAKYMIFFLNPTEIGVASNANIQNGLIKKEMAYNISKHCEIFFFKYNGIIQLFLIYFCIRLID